MNATQFKSAKELLMYLNGTYAKLHSAYENLFWTSYMGDHGVDVRMTEAMSKRDTFRSNPDLAAGVDEYLKKAKGAEKERLQYWKLFFSKYQIPAELLPLKKQINELEQKIRKVRSDRTEGYVDPSTGKFVAASELKMRTLMRTNSDEAIRKACFDAMEKLPHDIIVDYVELIKLRNQFAHKLGYEDFYAYKLQTEEGMEKKDLFRLWDDIYEKTKYGFDNLRELEKSAPGLRKPWNTGYMMTGDFTKEEDQYFPFEDALERWGRSFAALGVDFHGGKITLDLLDRKGKWNNGFCHWPNLVTFEKSKRVPGTSNFTCNVVYGQPGSSYQGYVTLFHEGGHAAHYLSSMMRDVCINHEYPPSSTAWAETQSMFMDTLMSGIDWKTRYAKNAQGEAYPLELFERKLRKIMPLVPLGLMGIMDVSSFEKSVYELKDPKKDDIIRLAKDAYKKFEDRDGESIGILNVPHLYSFEAAAAYHGYGLAELALTQWREYFYKKYGYIVDNPKVGREMARVWKLAASKTFPEFVQMATGNKLSAGAFIREVTGSLEGKIAHAKKKIARLKSVRPYKKDIRLNATVVLVHGKQKIADSSKGFEKMSGKYAAWLKKGTHKDA